MFSVEKASVPYFSQEFATSVVRGDLINIEGRAFGLVEKCEEQGANVIVKCVGEAPVLVSKDRMVSVRSYRYGG